MKLRGAKDDISAPIGNTKEHTTTLWMILSDESKKRVQEARKIAVKTHGKDA